MTCWTPKVFGKLLGVLFLLAVKSGLAADLPAAASGAIDFEKQIQPIFSARCIECHGPEKQKSGFRLDQRESVLKGGDLGKAIIPGNSAASPLIRFVAGLDDEIRMPPKGDRLTLEEIGLLRGWIDQGAKWPEGIDGERAPAKGDYWTFRPVQRPGLPSVVGKDWVRNEIDLFVKERLEKEGLDPSQEADRRTLLRRVYFDLTGLPPTPLEVEEFLADKSATGYERVVDRLLESPRYGERWARHWLDTVHYGETHGYDKDKTRPNAWPYRDYVIRALNNDKPYSQFIQEQLAGDILFPGSADGVIATGFIAAGPWDFVGHVELPESKTDGLIARYNDRDDMVMTAMSTFQSLTVHCARCHDHKFDPISQEEYYRLQAVFAGVDRADRLFDEDPAVFGKRAALLREKKAIEKRQLELNQVVVDSSPALLKLIDRRRDELRKELDALPKSRGESGTIQGGISPSNGYHSEVAARLEATKWVQVDLGKLLALDEIRLWPARPTDFPDTPGFGFPIRFKVEIADDPAFEKPKTLLDSTGSDYQNPGDKPIVVAANGHLARVIRVTAMRLWERTGDYVFALGELQALSGGRVLSGGAGVSALDSIEAGRWSKAFLVDGYDSRERLSGAEDDAALQVAAAKRPVLEAELKQLADERKQLIERLVDESIRKELSGTEARLAEINQAVAAMPVPKKVYAAANDFAPMGSFKPAAGGARPVHVLRRGEVQHPIRPAAAGALSCLPGLTADLGLSETAPEGDRRAALARWLTDSRNLLTRRSIVNRVWQYHFGRGIVDTPNDFGRMGSAPTHPELLDWLAFWFLDQGESLKKLHRLILMSATYRQSSADNAMAAKKDGDNRLLWRMNRSRLDAEALRDAILFVSGKLDLKMGGPSVQQFYFKDDHSPVYDYTRFDPDKPEALRRSVYRFIVRSVPDPFMETLDCPDASLLAPKRNTTVTALQALTLLNNAFVLKQAEAFAARLGQYPAEERIDRAFELALARRATADELARWKVYGEKHGMTNVCRLLLNSSEFMFVD